MGSVNLGVAINSGDKYRLVPFLTKRVIIINEAFNLTLHQFKIQYHDSRFFNRAIPCDKPSYILCCAIWEGNMPDEKFDEKDKEKREEKSPQEKNWDEKWRRDPLNAIVWALIFIWAGFVLLVFNLGLVIIGGLDAWSVILVGAGIIVLIEVAFRLAIPAYRRPITGSLIFAIILLGIGLGSIISWNVIWPLVLVALGVAIILRGLFRQRS